MIRNLKIGVRLTICIALIMLIAIAVSVIRNFSIDRMTNIAEESYEKSIRPLTYMVDFSIAYGNVRSAVRDLHSTISEERNNSLKNSIEQDFKVMENAVSEYLNLLETNDFSEEQRTAVRKINEALVVYKDALFNRIVPAAMVNSNAEAGNLREAELNEPGNIIREQIAWLTQYDMETSGRLILEIQSLKDNIAFMGIVFVLVGLIVAVSVLYVMVRSITKPIDDLMNVSNDILRGNLNVNAPPQFKDEIGVLSSNFLEVADVIKALIADMGEMSRQHNLGDIDFCLNESAYAGSYQELAQSINQMVNAHIKTKREAMHCIGEIASGNFDASIEQLPGKKAFINRAIDDLRERLQEVNHEINIMIKNALAGNLAARIDVTHYKGDWVQVMEGLNELLNSTATPIQEADAVLQQVAIGNFNMKMEGDYQGDFLRVKNSINDTVTNVASYIEEISAVLIALANDDLDQEITRKYMGAFSNIKDALNNIIDKFNNVISDIASASEQVAAGAKQMSESSMALAQGAAEQASTVQELNATITTINEKTMQNAKSAKEADELSSGSKDSAVSGDNDMENMLISMDGIKESSNNISKIIKAIDDIAFQTNLLALNAAVEAARAGVHGKGFAVVAEEVRSLAGRSQNAAKETAVLIEESINRVNEGTKIADTTATALKTIVNDVTKVSDIITDIAHASNEQTAAIAQITEGISQITNVTQQNSASSEESASVSEELSGQAEVLRGLVDVFKLKRR